MKTVLIIDDTNLGRTLGALAARGRGRRVLTARDGVEALDLYERYGAECVLLNRHTPAIRTEEFLERVRRAAKRTRLIVRGLAMTERTIASYRARGADSVLNGPHDNEVVTLREAIDGCVKHGRLADAG